MKNKYFSFTRIIELGLLLGTVVMMFMGYRLQLETHRLQNRPHVFFKPDDNTLTSISDGNYSGVLMIKNTSNSPAYKLKSYGLIVVDGEPVYGLECLPCDNPKEATEFVELQRDCNTSFPPISIAQRDFKVCVLNSSQPHTIPPGTDFSVRFSVSKLHFDMLLNAKNPARSGIFYTAQYEGYDGKEKYSTQLGVLPYKDTSKTYSLKIH